MTERVSILGATSQLARDFVRRAAESSELHLTLYARRPDALQSFAASLGRHYDVRNLQEFDRDDCTAILNFIGVGDPARAAAMGTEIISVTEYWDNKVLAYLRGRPECRYVFLSSGAVYGDVFSEPANERTRSCFAVNAIRPQDFYGLSKLSAEARHRADAASTIIDVRVFSYVSNTSDMEARFFITDMLRAIRDDRLFETTDDVMVRDYAHPNDMFSLFARCLQAPIGTNISIDAYSLAPVDKTSILAYAERNLGLRYCINPKPNIVNATGGKSHYYSLNRAASAFGYAPMYDSLQAIGEAAAFLLRGDV